MKRLAFALCALFLLEIKICAQGENAYSTSPAAKIPSICPSGDIISWDGKIWNVSNNRGFKARFERYLSVPEEEGEDSAYFATLEKIIRLLKRGHNEKAEREAFDLLSKAAEFPNDAHLCDVIAHQLQTTVRANRRTEEFVAQKTALEEERKRMEWNRNAAQSSLGPPSGVEEAGVQSFSSSRMEEIHTLLKTNAYRRICSDIDAKVGLQTLIIQLFFQRRFQHALIAIGFYRGIFTDGDEHLYIGAPTWNFFFNAAGVAPAINTIEMICNAVGSDVTESLNSFSYLMDRNELNSATRRLAEAYIVGEHLPEMQGLSILQKRRILEFFRKTNQLDTAIEVKDYALAEKLIEDLQCSARDFNTSKYMAQIENSKFTASIQLIKSRNANLRGDRRDMEKELALATEIWPTNPELKEASNSILSQINVEENALVDFTHLVHQRSYYQIGDDKFRFIAALAHHPAKEKQLLEILDDVAKIERIIVQAQKAATEESHAAAWEIIEIARQQFPENIKLIEIHGELTLKAADFVHRLRMAQALERNHKFTDSLRWYQEAKRQYTASIFAEEGIQRLTGKGTLSVMNR